MLLVAGDASEYAFAAYTPGSECRHPIALALSIRIQADRNRIETGYNPVCLG